MRFRILLIFISSLFIVGLLFGCMLVLFIPVDQQLELTDRLQQFFAQLAHDPIESNLWSSIIQTLLISITIFLLGLTVIGTPLVLLFMFIKGALIGFTTSFIIQQMGGKGVVFVLYSVIPQNLIIIPVLILYSTSCIFIALYIFNNRILKFQGKLRPHILSYTAASLVMTLILVLASLYESKLAPLLMERSLLLFPNSFLLFDLYSLSLL